MDWSETYYAPVRYIQLIQKHPAQADPVITRGIHILGERIAHRCGAAITRRTGDYSVTICLDSTIGTDGFRITGDASGAVIAGNCPRAIVYGLGKYLRTSGYSASGFHPSRWQGESVPAKPFRGIQLDTHWCNFYHTAPAHELQEYVADLALWGINYMEVVFPFIDLHNWEDPEVNRITGQIKIIHDTAKSLGIKVGMEIVPNQDFVDQNMNIQADVCFDRPGGTVGHNICPNKPGAMTYILTHTYGRVFKHLKAHGVMLDFLCFWPYDEGGCACEACAPWGANGYLKVSKALYEAIRSDVPGVEVILSTWGFDVGKNGKPLDTNKEWAGLSHALEADSSWIDYILADSHGDFPHYPLEHGAPAGLPLINYPEISMYKLNPWGGYGANPLPNHFERLWRQAKDLINGGMAYSEGIFNDINKVIVSQFYWNSDVTADETLREYIHYEYSPAVYDTVRQAICDIESNHGCRSVDADTEKARQACEALLAAEKALDAWAKKGWRWRILAIRAQLDLLRYTRAKENPQLLENQEIRFASARMLKDCEEAKVLLTELTQIYHSNLDFNEKTHPHYALVRPPLMDI